MNFTPINIVMFAVGGIMIFAAKDNKSPGDIVKSALNLKGSATASPNTPAVDLTGEGVDTPGAVVGPSRIAPVPNNQPISPYVNHKYNGKAVV